MPSASRSIEPDRATGRAAPLPTAERREAIIAAVLPLLAERGAAVTSRELAIAAGVAEGTIFKAFTDKTDLFTAALDRVSDPAPFERAVAEIDPTLGYEERLVAAASIMQIRLVHIWNLFSKLASAPLPARPRTLDDSPATVALFASEPGRIRVRPDEAARRFRALVLALSHPLLHTPPPSAAELVDQFLHGVAAR